MKPRYKAIVVVLASEDNDVKNTRYVIPRLLPEWRPMYSVFKDVWEQYCNCEPLIKTVFVYGGGIKEFIPRRHDWIYEDIYENNHPGMITKTLRAFEDIEATYDYDFIVRTNLSTFWDYPKLLERLNTLPIDNCLCGTPVRMHDAEKNLLEYIAGYDLIISRNIVQELIAHKDEVLNVITPQVYCCMEDLALCTAAAKYVDPLVTINTHPHRAFQMLLASFDQELYNHRLKVYNDQHFDHVRAKTRKNRNVDKQVLIHLLHDVYGKTLLPSDNARTGI